MDNEVMDLIDKLYNMVSEAWGVPLGNDKCILDRSEVLDMLDAIKESMPIELAEAKRLVSARDEFISNAKREAESIRKLAEEKSRAMVQNQEVIRIAKAESEEMLQSAKTKSDQLRQMASKYAEEVLKMTEEAVQSTADQLHNQSKVLLKAIGDNEVVEEDAPVEEKKTKKNFKNFDIEA